MNIQKIRKTIPDYVYQVADVLNENGYKAYLVGGAVRNMLLGLTPKDYDIATDALPDQIEKVFPRSVNVNAKFGTIIVIMESKTGERFDVEVTTFRKEEEYFGGRWPGKVEFINDLYEDLSRRDFTVDALAIDLNNINDEGATADEIIVDHFNGKEDLENKIIRAVGNPVDRLTEDGLRSYRACRIASVYGFTIEKDTFNAIKETLHVAKLVSMERIRDEFLDMIYKSAKPSVGIELLREAGLLQQILPEVLLMKGVIQPKFHADDLYNHSLLALDIAEDSVKLAAFFHDIGKINTMSEDASGIHFYGHDVEGAKITENILTRMKFPKAEIQRIVKLVRWHMFYYPSADWRKEYGEEIDLEAKDHGWTDAAVRRFVKKVGEDSLEDLFKVRIADANSNPKSNFQAKEIDVFANRIGDVRSKDMALKVSDLQINGEDLKAIGIEMGPQIGLVLNRLLDLVIEDPGMNSKELLIDAAKDILKHST